MNFENREATVQALNQVKLLALTREDLMNTLGDQFQVLYFLINIYILQAIMNNN